MVLVFLGFVLTSVIVAVILAYKFTHDICPHRLKKKLINIAVSNWQNKLAYRFSSYKLLDPKSIADTGLFPAKEEFELEKPFEITSPHGADDLMFYSVDNGGNILVVKITRFCANFTDVSIYLKLDGVEYSASYKGTSTSAREFTLGNMKLEMVEPMRTWRLWYNGVLETKNGSSVHAVLNLLWKALDFPQDSRKHANADMLSEYMAGNGTFGENFAELPNILPEGYYQFGSYHGTVKIDDAERAPLYLYGHRVRRFISHLNLNPLSDSNRESNNRLELFAMCGTDGNALRLVGLTDGWIDGHISYASRKVKPIIGVDVPPSMFTRNSSLPKLFVIKDDKASYRIEIWPAVESFNLSTLQIVVLKLAINGNEGRGILLRKLDSIIHCSDEIQSSSISRANLIYSPVSFGLERAVETSKHISEIVRDKIVDLESENCSSISLVGGKGASLAQLAKLVGKCSEFKTAKGFCVTTQLFRETLSMDSIEEMFSTSGKDVTKACSEVISFIKSTEAENKLSSLITPWMEKEFGENRSAIRFAVRSSGVLEDAEDLSCAGQNETFLGIKESSVSSKIVECWASLFTTQSVTYRLNHGQPAVSEMGVVVQEMVHAATAGVLFTADPRTGNPFELIITANYGLGESVVSALSDPDTIIVLRSRKSKSDACCKRDDKDLTIGRKSLGEKKAKIIVSEDGSSTKEIAVSDADAKNYCLSDEAALKLGVIAVKIEKELGQLRPIDIEWAIGQNGDIYILQSRAITSLDSWTDFEILHEMDSALRTTFERMTTANTGEVMPNTVSPLSEGIIVRMLDAVIQKRSYYRCGDSIIPYALQTMASFRHRVFINVINTMYRTLEKDISPAMVSSDLAVFGHRVLDEEMHRISLQRYGILAGKEKLISFVRAIKTVMSSKSKVEMVEKKYSNYRFECENVSHDVKALYNRLTEELFRLYDIMYLHTEISECSTIAQVFAFIFLSENRKVDEWDHILYEDVSTILSVCSNVESADMPVAMQELSDSIVEYGKNINEFLGSSGTVDALKWIRGNDKLSNSLDKFFEKHGHRCIAELDLGTKSWKTDPTPLITIVKSIVMNKTKRKDTWTSSARSKFANDDALLDSLKAPIKTTTRRLLKLILPYCRSSVMYRERTKSLLVWTIDQFKLVYYQLAELMVKEKLIPDQHLLFHLTHIELGQLINKDPHTSRILYKALRRQKLRPEMDKCNYHELYTGIPEPIDENIPIEITESIQGTPVSSGKCQGTGRVCLTVEEASEQIQPGDILITHATDIAWSPFFPLLGGVVTELGGLISHGAVVAREYGLPCIVGAMGATKVFKSGEQVILDAGKGTLSKIK